MAGNMTTDGLPQAALLDDVMGHRDGSLVRQSASDLIAQVVSQSALQGYVAGAGAFDASAGAFPSGAEVGDAYVTTTGGTVDGVQFAAGDLLIALVATPATDTFAGNWSQLVSAPSADDVAETANRKWMTPDDEAILGAAATQAGTWSPASGAFPANARSGAMYTATDAGSVDGVGFRAGDIVLALVATPATDTFEANWARLIASPNADDVSETAARKWMTPDDQAKLASTLMQAGQWDPASGAFPANAAQGAVFYVAASGSVDGQAFAAGDMLVAIIATPATDTFAGNWQRLSTGPGSASEIAGFDEQVHAIADENALGARPDPGQQPTRFRDQLAPGGTQYSAADVVASAAGKGIGIVGEAVVALDSLIPIGIDAVDQVAFEVQRTVEISDPAGDGVTFGVVCFGSDGTQLAGADGFIEVHSFDDLDDVGRTGSWYAQVSRAAFPSVNVILPGAARYYAPAVRSFGANPGLCVRRCEALPIARGALKAVGPDAGGFTSFEKALEWITNSNPDDGRPFEVMGLKFTVQRQNTTVPGLPGAAPMTPVYVDHFGQGKDLTDLQHGTAAVKAALASGMAQVMLRSRESYTFDETLMPVSGFELIGADKSAVLKQGPNARPGVYFQPGVHNAWLRNMTYHGNRPEAGAYNSFFTSGGISSGSTAGDITAALPATAQTVPLEGLGEGFVLAGDALEWRVAGVLYRRIIQQDVTLAAGAGAFDLDAPLGVAVEAEQTFFVKQPRNRMVLKQAYNEGENRLVLRAAQLTSSANTLLKGYQFAFHTDSNYVKAVDYSEIYTLAEDAVAQQVNGVWEVEIELTEGLKSDKVLGQLVTSFQDHENNIATSILALGTTDCGVEDLIGADCQLHFAQANACIYSPTFGIAPEDNPNVNFAVTGCLDYSTEPGNCFGAAHADFVTFSGNWGMQGSLQRNFIQFEQCEKIIAFSNQCAGYKSGIMFTGESRDALFYLNTAENCTINYWHRNISANASWSSNVSIAGPNTERGLRLQAGDPDLDDGDVAFKSRVIATGNTFSGGEGKAVAGDYPASSIVVQPTRLGSTVNDLLRPQLIEIARNVFDAPLADAVILSQAAYVSLHANLFNRPGQRALWADNCERLMLGLNRVFDAGDNTPAAAYHLRDCVETIWDNNEATILTRPKTDSGQEWGLYLEGVNTFVSFDGTQMLDGVNGKVNDSAPLSHVFMGFNAGRAHGFAADSRITGIGGFALADALDAAIRTTGVGWGAGRTVTTSRYSTFLGAMSDVSDGTLDGVLSMGYNAQARQEGELAMGPRDGINGLRDQSDGTNLTGTGSIILPSADLLAELRWNGVLYAIPLFRITDPNPVV
ncbi:hypothetical protein [uncultured Tateyamaria sp.]|uniref:hypothetical protein n=1 Tax=uncultured Tateyamaria sp. TaxID=455651 RepID=UPI00261F6809|nr:hypothetical protein [uncultured Tateyamaria sp.]